MQVATRQPIQVTKESIIPTLENSISESDAVEKIRRLREQFFDDYVRRNWILNFKVDKDNNLQINLLISYFTQNEVAFQTFANLYNKRFAGEIQKKSGGYDLTKFDIKKGLFLIGKPGTGKTKLLKIFQKILLNTSLRAKNPMHFVMQNALEVSDDFQINGAEIFQKHKREKKAFCYDEIGVSREAETRQHFGNKINAIEQLILHRYDVNQENGAKTHYTSNSFPSKLNAIYHERTVSRLINNSNVIIFHGEDRRSWGKDIFHIQETQNQVAPARSEQEVREGFLQSVLQMKRDLEQNPRFLEREFIKKRWITGMAFTRLEKEGVILIPYQEKQKLLDIEIQELNALPSIILDGILKSNRTHLQRNITKEIAHEARCRCRIKIFTETLLQTSEEQFKQILS